MKPETFFKLLAVAFAFWAAVILMLGADVRHLEYRVSHLERVVQALTPP